MSRQKMPRYTSPSHLYHFVGGKNPTDDAGNFEVLRKLLKDECISLPPHVKKSTSATVTYTPSESFVNGKLVQGNVICFCDIPPEALHIHVTKYGRFGLAIKREVLVGIGARPVMYFPFDQEDWRGVYGSTVLRDIESLYRALKDRDDGDGTKSRSLGQKPTTLEEMADRAASALGLYFLAYIKPFDASLPEGHPENYYMEREWRRLGNVRFEPTQVAEIVLPERFIDSLLREFPWYSTVTGSIERYLH